MSEKLTLLINSKNEEQNIKTCIKSVVGLADEILVVDMQSQDNTVKVAKKFGARIISVPDFGYVEPARQLGINAAKNDWILILDADEKLPSKLRKKIPTLINNRDAQIYRLPRKNIFLGKWLKYGLQWPDRQARLFRKKSLSWPPIIHTQPILNFPAINLPASKEMAIIHNYRSSVHQAARKFTDQAFHENYYINTPKLTLRQIHKRLTEDFTRRYIDNEGYKDGTHGFIIAKLWEYYRFLEMAYYLERKAFPALINNYQLPDIKKLNLYIYKLEDELNQIYDSKFYKLYKFYYYIKIIMRRLFL